MSPTRSRFRWWLALLPAAFALCFLILLLSFSPEDEDSALSSQEATPASTTAEATAPQSIEPVATPATTLPPELAAAAQRTIDERAIARGLAASLKAGAHPDFEVFLDWLKRWNSRADRDRDRLVEEGTALAERRRPRMVELVQSDPEAALAQAISWADWAALPRSVRVLVEEPFTARPDLDVFPLCHDESDAGRQYTAEVLLSGRDRVLELDFGDGTRSDTFAYGWRTESYSREGLPVQGIRIDNLAALHEPVFQHLVRPRDIEYVRENFPVANPDPTRDFSSGAPLPEQPEVALSGGQVFLFENAASLTEFEKKIAGLEKTIGPKAGSRLVHESLAAMDGEEGFDVDGAEIAFSQWTESNHTSYVILVDFPDRTGAPIAASTFQNRMDGPVHDLLVEMSFDKTGMTTVVDPTIYRMPQPTDYYDGTDGSGNKKNGDLYNHAIAAAEAAGNDPKSYNHRIIIFKGPSMGYCGLATVGGGKIWLPCTSVKVTLHELGHNYGLGHASYWSGTGGNPVDPGGSSSEYGDNTDMMGGGNDPNGHFHAQGKRKLNWIESSQTHNVDSGNSGDTVRLYRFDHPGLNPSNTTRAIRVTKGSNEYYWIAYRQRYTATKFENYEKGVQILWQRPNANKSWLIDTTPGSTGGKDDAGTAIARTYSDPGANIHVTPTGRGGSSPDEWVDVVVNLGPFPGNRAPNVSISAPDPVPPGQSVRLQIVGSDPDGDDMAYAWDFDDGVVRANRSWIDWSWATPGTYPVTCHVTDMKGGVTTAQLDVQVSDILPPSNLTATDGTWEDRVTLSWSAPAVGSPTYRVLRAANDEEIDAAIELATTTATTHEDYTAEPGVPYRYWIQAVYSGGRTANSQSNTGYRFVSSPAPLITTSSADGVHLSWRSLPGTDEFRVFRSIFPNASNPVLVATVAGDVSSHLDDTTQIGGWYYYFVEAVAGGLTGAPSNTARARRLMESPGDLEVSQDDFNQIRLDWTGNPGATSYLVFRSRTSRFQDAVHLGSTPNLFYIDRTAVPGFRYHYWVRGFSAINGFSDLSSTAPEGRRLGGPSRPITRPDSPPTTEDGTPVETMETVRQRFEGFVMAPDDPDATAILGKFNGNLTQTTLSVGVIFDGARWSGRGPLDENGNVLLEMRSGGRDPLAAEFQLTRTQDGANRLMGSLGASESPDALVDAGCLDLHPVKNPASFAGKYTVVLPQDPNADPTTIPAGDSVGIGFATTSGRYWFRVYLADGAVCTMGGTTTGEGEFFCFGRPYRGPDPGLLAGKLVARTLASVSDLDGQWRWTRPAEISRPELYADGFDLERIAVASLYQPPVRGERILSLLADTGANALWSLRGGNLTPVPSSRHVTWNAANKVSGADLDESEELRLRISTSNGLVTGLYRKLVGEGYQTVPFLGVALQNQGLVTGHFPGRGQSGWFVLEPTGLPDLTVTDASQAELGPGTLLDFGEIGAEGGHGERLIELTNAGDGNLRLTRLPEVTGEGFSLGAARRGDLSPGESVTLRLTFDPATMGNAVGQLAIHTNDSTANPYLLNLTGTGIVGDDSSIESGTALSPIAIGDPWIPADLEPVSTFDAAHHESRYGSALAFTDENGNRQSLAASGFLHREVISLRLVVDRRVGVLTGSVETDGSFTISRWVGALSRDWNVTNLSLAEPVGGGIPAIVGELQPIDSESSVAPIALRLEQLPWTGRNPSPVSGPFTFILPATEHLGAGLPNGDGVAVGAVNRGGLLRARLFLPDGQRQALAVPLDANATAHFVRSWPLGELSGHLRFRELPAISDADGHVAWHRPPHPRGGAFGRGFYLERPLLASAWQRPLRGETALKGLPNTDENTRLIVTGAPAPPLDPVALTWQANHRLVATPPVSGDLWRLSISPGNGLVNAALRRPTLPGFSVFRGFGVVFDQQNLVTGYLLDDDENCVHLLIEPTTP